MSRLLQIRDDDGVILYNLLTTKPSFDLKSRQVAPISAGRWQETFSMFAGSGNVAKTIAASVFDLDVVVKSINDYGASPVYNSPIWLHEKTDGENDEIRRAPLFSATQQPARNALQISNGYTGLLSFERGDWEAIEETTVAFPATVDNYFDTIAIERGGSIDGRISEINILSQDIGNQILAVGYRGNNWGTANFQPCVNWGAGTSANGTLGTGIDVTKPVGQTPTYTLTNWDTLVSLLPDTITIAMSGISLSTLDSVNRDYVGEYIQFLRFALFVNGNTDVFLKLTPFSGYAGEYTYLDPVYINAEDSGSVYGDRYRGVMLGRLSIPNSAYLDVGDSAETLANFKIGIDLEWVGTPVAPMAVLFDSSILIPANGVILDNTESADWNTNVDSSVLQSPDGSITMVSRGERINADISLNGNMPSGGGVAVYYSEHYSTLGASPEREISTTYHTRYNSLSG